MIRNEKDIMIKDNVDYIVKNVQNLQRKDNRFSVKNLLVIKSDKLS